MQEKLPSGVLFNEIAGTNSRTTILVKKPTKEVYLWMYYTAQKMKISIKDFFSKCDQIRSILRI